MITSTILSTAEVASLLKVNESTVKRWTEKGTLHCFKTPGGHRKYSQEDVAEFIERFGFKIDPPQMFKETTVQPPAAVSADYAILTKNYAILAAQLTEILLRGSNDETFQFLNLLRINRFTLVELCDKIAAEALRHIGTRWVERTASIEQEHVATHCTLSALRHLQSLVPKKPRISMTALCGCFEDEFHEVGITCVRNILDTEGWNTVYLGPNLPAESFTQAIGRFRPQLVCVSATTPKNKLQFRRDCAMLYEATRQAGAKLIVGGSATMQGGTSKISADFIAQTVGDVLSWTQKQFRSPVA